MLLRQLTHFKSFNEHYEVIILARKMMKRILLKIISTCPCMSFKLQTKQDDIGEKSNETTNRIK